MSYNNILFLVENKIDIIKCMYEHPTLTDINLIIAKRLKERREMLGMSHQELSKSANINVKQVQKYENATIPIAGSALYFLARELKVPLKYFIDIPHIKPPNEYFFTAEDDYKFFEHIIAEDSEEYIAPPKADCQFIADSPVRAKSLKHIHHLPS
ncbi:helix-turn-helix domain-containing protein [Candidatus Tisiphia endosymbiont of Nemotelus uliginosus]|uniref:helix-turn-helix domain-containing protein n=1 Tax=Candidatus Tisiphia endosymbiont of Nemotelus uliginosus TaxID=3077926 RepID=UPI0035C8BAF2